MPDFVYVLSNPTIPNLVKIGFTTDIEQRIKDLSRPSSVPVAFVCEYCRKVKDGTGLDVEAKVQDAFKDHRINPKREFFRINPERVKSALELCDEEDATPADDIVENQEEQMSLKREKERETAIRERFNFSMLEIPIGSELTLDKSDEKIAKVVGEKEVEYKGDRGSLGRITKNIFEGEMGINWKTYRGTDHWSFEGENLTTRRIRLEDSSN